MNANDSIAIISTACRFPGASTPHEYWNLLTSGDTAISEVPPDRWIHAPLHSEDPNLPGKTYVKSAGFIENIFEFDPLFFRISNTEAKYMDPQQRLMLEVAWEAFENAAIIPSSLAGSSTGVFIAANSFEYGAISTQHLEKVNFYSGTGTTLSVIANRLSYIFDLAGPSLVVDTACSASLVAVHLACQSLLSGECNLAITGGVTAMLSPVPFVGFSKANVLSAKGFCKSFDAGADGFTRGEGCGVVLLKRLSDAQRDQDNILAIVKGSAVNQDGLSNGISAPSGPAQEKVIRDAWENAKVNPDDISYVEAHGTATLLGDPIELKALKKIITPNDENPKKPCLVGSCKANIGHLEPAAGIASLIKVILAHQHRVVPGQPNFETLNHHIDLNGSRLKIADRNYDWDKLDSFAIAGISGFGVGGTNCHLVVGRYDNVISKEKNRVTSDQALSNLFLLSAKNSYSLKRKVSDLLDYLKKNKNAVDLDELSHTLQCGREFFAKRLAIIADSNIRLKELLQIFIEGNDDKELIEGMAKKDVPQTVTKLERLRIQDLSKLANLWVSGVPIIWSFYREKPYPSFLYDLPTYPYHRKSFRFSEEHLYSQFSTEKKYLHPLIHKNQSTLHSSKFFTKLSGSEEVLHHHIIGKHHIIPATAHIEALSVAAKLATDSSVIQMENIVFIHPLIYSAPALEFETECQWASSNKTGVKNQVSCRINSSENKQLHSRGKFSIGKIPELPFATIDVEKLKEKSIKQVSRKEFYSYLLTQNLKLGLSFQTIESGWLLNKNGSTLVKLKRINTTSGYFFEPGLLDGVFQSLLIEDCVKKNSSPLFLPFSIKTISKQTSLPKNIYALAHRREKREGRQCWDIKILDTNYQIIVEISKLTTIKDKANIIVP